MNEAREPFELHCIVISIVLPCLSLCQRCKGPHGFDKFLISAFLEFHDQGMISLWFRSCSTKCLREVFSLRTFIGLLISYLIECFNENLAAFINRLVLFSGDLYDAME